MPTQKSGVPGVALDRELVACQTKGICSRELRLEFWRWTQLAKLLCSFFSGPPRLGGGWGTLAKTVVITGLVSWSHQLPYLTGQLHAILWLSELFSETGVWHPRTPVR